MTKNALILGAAITAVLSSNVATAGLAVNAGATTNYLWRGVTQSIDTASVFGGVDWSADSGLYAGIWNGSLIGFGGPNGAGAETDVYGGFAGEAGDIGYDIGIISYQYTLDPGTNFTEAYIKGTFSMISVGVYSTIDAGAVNDGGAFDKGDLYVNASADFTAGPFDTSVFFGTYKFTNSNEGTNPDFDYNHYGIKFTSGEVSVALEKTDIDSDDNVRVVATWAKSWDI